MEFRNTRSCAVNENGRPNKQSLMWLLVPQRRFDPHQPEQIDRPELDNDSLRLELEALERANRRLCGHQLMVHYVQRLVRWQGLKSISVLDLGTGVADIPRALIAWGRRHDVRINITAVDGSSRVLVFARKACRDWPEISFAEHNLLSLPYAPASFDLVICSLALHHFDRRDAVIVLRRVSEIAKVSYLVNDLRRNWFSTLATPLLAGAIMKHDIVRQDALASSRAAFSVRELRGMAEEAGLANYRINRHHLGFRMVLHGTK
jgi:ubiquinone/menaquinone biosynthesis C-methylase UbiE